MSEPAVDEVESPMMQAFHNLPELSQRILLHTLGRQAGLTTPLPELSPDTADPRPLEPSVASTRRTSVPMPRRPPAGTAVTWSPC